LREVKCGNVGDAETEIAFEDQSGLFEAKAHFLGQESNLVGDVLIVQGLPVSMPSDGGFSHGIHGHLHRIQPKSTQIAHWAFAVVQNPLWTQNFQSITDIIR
jgi:hypothetical protein